jgi:hypothetical protein
MGGCLRELVALSRVAAKRRQFELLAASCLVPLSLGLSEPALAQMCTPVANGGSLGGANPTSTTCTGTFNTNINFTGIATPPTTLQTVTLSGAQVLNIPAGSPPAGAPEPSLRPN